MEIIQNIDWSIMYWVQDFFKCTFMDFIMPFITDLCEDGIFWIICGVVMVFFKKYRRYGIFLLLAMLLGSLIGNEIIKPLVARPRPCWLDTTVPMVIDVPKSFSFPSGHTLTSAVAATVITASNRKLGYIAIPLATLIAFSRIYLFVHFPSDILMGALIGTGVGLFVVFGGNWLFKRFPVLQKIESR